MSAKRTSTESSLDEQTIECSDSVFQQEDNVKRTKLVSPSDTTLQDLPNELLDYILIKVVDMEVNDAKLAKSAWQEKADRVIDRLSTVCSRWCSVLTTNFFRNKVHRILEGTAQESIRLEIFQRSCLKICASEVTTMKDEMFVLGMKYYMDRKYNNSIYVYDRNNLAVAKDVIQLPEGNPLCLAACSLSKCLYLLNRKQWYQVSVLRITKDDVYQFDISTLISDQCLPNPTLSVTANGGLILSRQRGDDQAVISVYDANGSLQHEMNLLLEFSNLSQVIPKSNGNLVLVLREKGQYKAKLTEIDLNGNILHQYLPSASGGNMKVSQADNDGRMLIFERRSYRLVLLDAELNLLSFTVSQQDEHNLSCSSIFHYNSERNEIVTFHVYRNTLSISRFADE